MDKLKYWELFKETGKIEDYIKYCNVKNEKEENNASQMQNAECKMQS